MIDFIWQETKISLRTTRCYECGNFWAVEARVPAQDCRCPVCAGRKVREANGEVTTLTKRLNSQKAATTRAKARAAARKAGRK